MNFLPAGRLGAPGATVGVRPEHLRLASEGPLAGTITHVERLGADTNLLVTLGGGETLTVRLFGQHPQQVGDAVALAFDPANAFSFDREGRRIRH